SFLTIPFVQSQTLSSKTPLVCRALERAFLVVIVIVPIRMAVGKWLFFRWLRTFCTRFYLAHWLRQDVECHRSLAQTFCCLAHVGLCGWGDGVDRVGVKELRE